VQEGGCYGREVMCREDEVRSWLRGEGR